LTHLNIAVMITYIKDRLDTIKPNLSITTMFIFQAQYPTFANKESIKVAKLRTCQEYLHYATKLLEQSFHQPTNSKGFIFRQN
jgi:hypothetical protein